MLRQSEKLGDLKNLLKNLYFSMNCLKSEFLTFIEDASFRKSKLMKTIYLVVNAINIRQFTVITNFPQNQKSNNNNYILLVF